MRLLEITILNQDVGSYTKTTPRKITLNADDISYFSACTMPPKGRCFIRLKDGTFLDTAITYDKLKAELRTEFIKLPAKVSQ